MSISVRMVRTGTVRVRTTGRPQPAGRPVPLRRLRLLLARRWTEAMPIAAFVVEHPEGRILFDMGEYPGVGQRGFFPRWQLGARIGFDFRIRPAVDDGLGAWLRAQDAESARPVRAIVLSHLHHDHTGALTDFPDVPVYVGREHWETYRSRLRAEAEAVVPRHWPRGFVPRFLEPTGPAVGPWPHTYPVTADGRVFAVDTPGHMPGHVSLVVRGDEVTYLLAGDAAYTLDELDAEVPDGFSADPRGAVESLRKIKEFARQEDVVVLPSHDPRAAARLANFEIYRPTQGPGPSAD
ncbi:N-acyl homoserine lactonase family protein [Streptomyces sp. NPDC001833]|uniref:N-acyl homoserine lactonase family protein n=1 Tax=Streptomyces sp. NPDC001833 TaxID=3154658 RepID=UPI00332E02A7